MFVCVPDTNVVVAIHRSVNPKSPNREFHERWRDGQFDIAYSTDTLTEYANKLHDQGIPDEDTAEFLALLMNLGGLAERNERSRKE